MTVMIEPDTKGIDGLSGELDDSVCMPTLIWDELVMHLGEVPPRPHIDPFDEEPWQELPTLAQLAPLWESTPMSMLFHQIVSGLVVEDLPRFIAEQRMLADIELAYRKEREAQDAEHHSAEPGQDGPVGSAEAGGGGQLVSGEPENGDPVGEGGQTQRHSDTGRPQKVSRGAGKGKA